MATAEQCRTALERLTERIAEMDAKDREAHLLDRTMSCHVTDLGVTFVTRLHPGGTEPIRQAAGGEPRAQVRFTGDSDTVVAVADDPGSLLRTWLSGRLKVHGNPLDLLHLRRLF